MGLCQRHEDILAARGFDVELLLRLGVRSSAEPSRADWIEFPVIRGGVEVNVKARTIAGEKRFSQRPNAVKTFWNFDVLTDRSLSEQPLVVTEGELDAIAAIQAGFVRTVSVPDGAPAEPIGEDDSGRKYAYLQDRDTLRALKDVREIILAVDSDPPGAALLQDLAIRLGKARCKWVRYPKAGKEHPQDCKDLADALQRYGVRGVQETLARAQWIAVPDIYRMSELPPLNEAVAYSTGIAGMDKHFKVRLGDFTVLVGPPGHGKTSFIHELTCRLAERYGWTIAIASFENRPQTDYRRQLRTFYNRKLVIDQSPEQRAAADRWIDERFVFVVPPEEEDASLKWLLERLTAAVVRFDAKVAVIDPWNELDHVRPPEWTLTEYTGIAIKQIKKLAVRLNVHIVLAAHPAKMRRDEQGKLPIPTLYDAADSANFSNKCDTGIIIYRKDVSRTLIRIQKTRFYEIGEPGDLEAIFLRDQARYEIIEPDRV